MTTGTALCCVDTRIPVFDSAMSATKVRTDAAATVPQMRLIKNDRLVTCRCSSTADAMAIGRTVMATASAAKASRSRGPVRAEGRARGDLSQSAVGEARPVRGDSGITLHPERRTALAVVVHRAVWLVRLLL